MNDNNKKPKMAIALMLCIMALIILSIVVFALVYTMVKNKNIQLGSGERQVIQTPTPSPTINSELNAEKTTVIVLSVSGKTLTVREFDGKSFELSTDSKTELKDNYGKPMAFVDIFEGMIVDIAYSDNLILSLSQNARSWELKHVVGVNVNKDKKSLAYQNASYRYDDLVEGIEGISPKDVVSLYGHNDRVLYVRVDNISSLDKIETLSGHITVVSSVKDFEFFVDNRPVSYKEPIELNYGRHTFKAKKEGYLDWELTLNFTYDEFRLSVDLMKVPDEDSAEMPSEKPDKTEEEQKPKKVLVELCIASNLKAVKGLCDKDVHRGLTIVEVDEGKVIGNCNVHVALTLDKTTKQKLSKYCPEDSIQHVIGVISQTNPYDIADYYFTKEFVNGPVCDVHTAQGTVTPTPEPTPTPPPTPTPTPEPSGTPRPILP